MLYDIICYVTCDLKSIGGVFMKYEYIKEESREYKYGQNEEFKNEYDARKYVINIKSQVIDNLIGAGIENSVEKIEIIKIENAFKLIALIKRPKEIFTL